MLAIGGCIHTPVWASTAAFKADSVAEHVIGDCQFRMKNIESGDFAGNSSTKFGGYSVGNDSDSKFWAVHMVCETLHPEVLAERANIKKMNGRWEIEDRGQPFPEGLRVRLYVLKGTNWDGAGTTLDQTDGEENRRTRGLAFCLVHETKALCGSSDVMYLTHPKSSVLNKVLKLLNSIEFIDGPPYNKTGTVTR
jgi:hypothetical protein